MSAYSASADVKELRIDGTSCEKPADPVIPEGYEVTFGSGNSFITETVTVAGGGVSSAVIGKHSTEDYVVMTDCDRICTVDYQKILDRHIESRADITIVTHRKKVTDEGIGKEILIDADLLGRIDDISEHTASDDGYHNVSMNIFVLRRSYLLDIIRDSIAHGYKSF